MLVGVEEDARSVLRDGYILCPLLSLGDDIVSSPWPYSESICCAERVDCTGGGTVMDIPDITWPFNSVDCVYDGGSEVEVVILLSGAREWLGTEGNIGKSSLSAKAFGSCLTNVSLL